MKRLVNFLAVAAASLALLVSCEKNDELLNPNGLPDKAQNFLDANFAGVGVQNVVKDYDDLSYTYKVMLADGTYVEFKKNGEWKDVENRTSGVPASVIPTKIASYIESNYPDSFVVDIERDRNYDVELSSGIDLVFSLDGDFLRVDM